MFLDKFYILKDLLVIFKNLLLLNLSVDIFITPKIKLILNKRWQKEERIFHVNFPLVGLKE